MTGYYPTDKHYIVWRSVPDTPKPKKLPCDKNGNPIDPHDPGQWMLRADAERIGAEFGYGVGYVLTSSGNTCVIDIDNCRDPATGAYTETATDIAKLCPGALMEVSVSGTGVHIWGILDKPEILDDYYNRDDARGIEIYKDKRFIAINPVQSRGDYSTVVLDTVVPQFARRRPEAPALPTGSTTGPETPDDELIKRFLNARRSPMAAMGQTASIADLWNNDARVLGEVFPSDTDQYDRSRADWQLAHELAFWTRHNVAQIERLMRRSALVRPKWDKHRSYLATTIQDAASKQKASYEKPERKVTAVDGDGFSDLAHQIGYFDGCTWIRASNRIMGPDGYMYDRNRFDAKFGGFTFLMEKDGARPTKSAWECFTASRMFIFPKANSSYLHPHRPFGQIDKMGRVNAMTYRAPEFEHGDVSPYLKLVNALFPDDNDRKIILSWMASAVQNPGVKFQWSPVIQGMQGNGKTFLTLFLMHAIGTEYCHSPNPEDMDEKYNDYIEGNLLITVEEVHMEGRRSLIDRMKKYITNERIEVRAMYEGKRMADNLANWIFLTNHKDAILMTSGDRRYAPFFTPGENAEDLVAMGLTADFFTGLREWADHDRGWEKVAGFLKTYPLDRDMDPAQLSKRAPRTSSTDEAVAESRTPIQQILVDAIDENAVGVRGGWVCVSRLSDMIAKRGRRHVNTKHITRDIAQMGYVPLKGRFRLAQEPVDRVRLYYLPEQVRDASLAGYVAAQGYLPD